MFDLTLPYGIILCMILCSQDTILKYSNNRNITHKKRFGKLREKKREGEAKEEPGG